MEEFSRLFYWKYEWFNYLERTSWRILFKKKIHAMNVRSLILTHLPVYFACVCVGLTVAFFPVWYCSFLCWTPFLLLSQACVCQKKRIISICRSRAKKHLSGEGRRRLPEQLRNNTQGRRAAVKSRPIFRNRFSCRHSIPFTDDPLLSRSIKYLNTRISASVISSTWSLCLQSL